MMLMSSGGVVVDTYWVGAQTIYIPHGSHQLDVAICFCFFVCFVFCCFCFVFVFEAEAGAGAESDDKRRIVVVFVQMVWSEMKVVDWNESVRRAEAYW